MPLDYRLAMAAPQERFGTLKDIMAIGQLHDQDRQQQQARIDAAQEQQARQVMQQVFAQHADDPETGIVELRRRGFLKQADELDKQLQARKKSILDQRKVELDILQTQGKIDADAAERERKAMEADSPEKILALYAGVTNPDEAEAAKGMMRLRFGSKADPVIAALGDYSPESVAFAGRTAMGPAKVADIANQNADNARAAEQNAQTAANAAATQTYQNRMATVAEKNAATSASRAAQTSTGAAGGGMASAADQKIAGLVMKSPAMYQTLTPTVRTRIAPILAEMGFQFEQSKTATGRPVTSGDAGRLSELTTSLDDVSRLRDTLKESGSTGIMPQLGAAVPNAVTQLTGFGEGAKQRQALIDRVKQVIGKALEGGVLRKEDEEKYKKILPTIGDVDSVVQTKLNGLESAIKQRHERLLESLSDAGYDTSRFSERGSNQTAAPGAVPKPVTDILASQPDGRYTLTDGSVWVKQGGKITKGGG